MVGSSNPFGQSSGSSLSGSQSLSGQTSNASSNLFATSAPFAAQTVSSVVGGTSTGVFGAPQASSPFASTTTVGSSSSPAYSPFGVCAREIVLNGNHPMCEILVLVPPDQIRELIGVSKRWRQLVTCPLFRRSYLTKWPSWKPSITLIGFFIRNIMKLGRHVNIPLPIPSCPMLSTSRLGCKI